MKLFLYGMAMLISLAGLSGCEKSSVDEGNGIPVLITGKWNYTAWYASIGTGEVNWQPVTPANKYVEFRPDGTFSSNLSPFREAITYQLVDSLHIKFTKRQAQDTLLYFFKLDSIRRELQLSPAILICIEGCSQKFIKN
jgi:hypothetical protein